MIMSLIFALYDTDKRSLKTAIAKYLKRTGTQATEQEIMDKITEEVTTDIICYGYSKNYNIHPELREMAKKAWDDYYEGRY